MRILLTGGAGYVGSACLRWMLEHGHDPIAYDNMSEGSAAAVPEDRLIVGDVADCRALANVMKQHDSEAVMHFAALASVPESIAQPDQYWDTNVIGTKNVLDAMRDANVDKLVFSSTAATYSFDVQMPITEDTDQIPKVPYGTTKLAAETMIKDYAQAYELGFSILRYFNASGADPDGRFGEDRRHETHLLPLILYTALKRREKAFVYGGDWDTEDGTCVRDFVHIDDIAQAHQLAVEHLEVGQDHCFNVGSGTGTTVMQVLRACEAAAGIPIPHEVVGPRPGDPGILVASSQKIIDQLGWSPQYADINDIVRHAWKWHSEHPSGYPK